jgi:hypothetical protein
MSEEKRRDRRPLLAILITAILAAILVIGAWLWAASQPAVVPTHDVNPPVVLWTHDPAIPGNELRNAGPIVGLAYRMVPDSFDSRADRLYAAMPERLYAFHSQQQLDPGVARNAWGTLHYLNVSDGGTRRTITAGPVALNYGGYVTNNPDYELYLGTDDGRLYIVRDTGDITPSGSSVVSHLDLDGAVTGIAAYNGDIVAPAAIEGTAVLTSFDGTRWVNRWLPSQLEDLGEFASLALDPSEQPYLAFYHVTTGQPRVARPQNGSWLQLGQMEPYQPTMNAGLYTSLAIGSDGGPRVAYYDEAETALKFARWDGSSWLTEYVDYAADVGRHASLGLDPLADDPRIAYYDETGSLWYAAWSGPSWNLEQVSAGGVGKYASLALSASGEPRIAYLDESNGRLMLAAKTGMAWSTETVAAVDSASAPAGLGDRGISLRIDSLDAPHIAYRNATDSSLGYATKAGAQWSTATVDDEGDVGFYPSLAVDGTGRPAIAYHDASSVDLKFARWTGTAWDVETVRSDGLVGLYTSLAFDAANRPHIASYEYNTSRTDADVVVAGTASGMLYGIDVSIPDGIARGLREKHVLSWRYRIRWATDVGAEVHLAGAPLAGHMAIPLYSPAFSSDGGLLFAGLRSAELVAVNSATGGIVWRTAIPGTTWGSAPISFRSPVRWENWVLAAGDDGTASLYDDAGILLASRAIAAGRLLTPAVTSDRAVFASSAGDALQVRLADLDLTITWSERLVGAASGSIAVREEALTTFLGDETGRLYSFRYDNGWLQYRAKFCDAVSAGPLVAVPPRSLQANVWFGCRDGSLYAVSSVSAPRPIP